MADPNLRDFARRVARIEKTHADGGGFDAEGTLGRRYFARRRRRLLPILAPFLFFLICGFVLKAAIHYQVGAEVYQARVERLKMGPGLSPLGGMLMQADPVTRLLSQQLRQMLG